MMMNDDDVETSILFVPPHQAQKLQRGPRRKSTAADPIFWIPVGHITLPPSGTFGTQATPPPAARALNQAFFGRSASVFQCYYHLCSVD